MEAVLQVASYNLVFTASTTPSSGEKESAFAVLYYKTANAATTKFNKDDECVGSVPRNAPTSSTIHYFNQCQKNTDKVDKLLLRADNHYQSKMVILSFELNQTNQHDPFCCNLNYP